MKKALKLEKQLNKGLLNLRKRNEAYDIRGEWYKVRFLKQMKTGALRYKLSVGRNTEMLDEFDFEMKRQGFEYTDDLDKGNLIIHQFLKDGQVFEFVQRML